MGITIFIIFWIVVAVIIAFIFYQRGKKVLAIFPGEKDVEILFRDRLATGHILNAGKTKFGNTDKSMDIIVTDEELWLKSSPFLAGTMLRQGLLQRIDKKDVKKLSLKNNRVEVSFLSVSGKKLQVNIQVKEPQKFIELVKAR